MWKPTDIYPTNYDWLYVAIISGGFDLRAGRNLGEERNGATLLLQYIALTENNGFDQLYAYDPKHTSYKTSDEDMYLIMDYEMHMGCTWEQTWTISSSRAHDYSKLLRYNYWETNVRKNEQKSLLFWCYLLKTHASQDIC